jgi:hypothetical protein
MRKTSMMKSFALVIIIVLSSIQVFSQRPFPRTQVVYSFNRQYRVQVKGYYYEGFAGAQSIYLMDVKGHILWKQVVDRRFLILPAVSNSGDVAITHREIKIYDKHGKLKSSFPLQDEESPYNTGNYDGAVHAFSLKSDRYFMFLKYYNHSTVELVCISDSAMKLWSKNLGDLEPYSISFYKDKMLVQDCGNTGIEYIKNCYVLDLNGNTLWQYQANSNNGIELKFEFNLKNGTVKLTNKSDETRIMLDTLNTIIH